MRLPEVLLAPPIAHRGRWGPGGAPENSLGAFERACRAGYGIELDVRLSADGEAVVFHDDQLERMTSMEGAPEDLPAKSLTDLALLGGPERIPTLERTLELVSGRAMLLVEIKSGHGGAERLAARTGELLDSYSGPAAAISFDPRALAWLAANKPGIVRGLDAMGGEEADAVEHLERACDLAKPHFLVLELSTAIGPAASRHRAEGRPVIAWTVRSPQDRARVAGHADNFIFEGFAPDG